MRNKVNSFDLMNIKKATTSLDDFRVHFDRAANSQSQADFKNASVALTNFYNDFKRAMESVSKALESL